MSNCVATINYNKALISFIVVDLVVITFGGDFARPPTVGRSCCVRSERLYNYVEINNANCKVVSSGCVTAYY